MICGSLLFLALWVSGAANAEDPLILREPDPVYEQSQALRADALLFLQGGAVQGALSKMQQASALRPTHPRLLVDVIRYALIAKDRAAAQRATGRYLALGLILPDGLFQAVVAAYGAEDQTDGLAALTKAQTDNQQAVGTATKIGSISTDFGLISDLAVWIRPEGQRVLIATSVTAQRALFSQNGIDWALGGPTEYNSVLGAAIGYGPPVFTVAAILQTPNPQGPKTALLLPATERLGGYSPLTHPAAKRLGDVVYAPSGLMYVTDPDAAQVFMADAAGLLPLPGLEGLISPEAVALDAQGQLYIADYGRGLWHYDPETQDATLMGWPARTTLMGLQDLLWHQGSLYALQATDKQARLIKLDIDLDNKAVTAINIVFSAPSDYQTLAGLAAHPSGDLMLLGQSDWRSYGEKSAWRADAPATPTPVLRIKP